MLSRSDRSKARFAEIILPLNLPQTLTYGIPVDLQDQLQPGMRVEVALGNNKLFAGIVLRLHDDMPDAYQVKPVRSILDREPVVHAVQLRFWEWISSYYMASPGEVMQAALPAHLKLMSETRLEWAGRQDHDQLNWSNEAWIAVEALIRKEALTISELREITGSRLLPSVLNELLENEMVYIHEGLEQSYRPRKEYLVVLQEAWSSEAALSSLFGKLQRAPKQLELLMAFLELRARYGRVSRPLLLDRSKAGTSVLKALQDRGVLYIVEQDPDRPVQEPGPELEIELSPAQQKAYEALQQSLYEKEVSLLQGVTGSGKTLLYIQQIKACIASGKQAVFLLPEIGLTTQLVARLQAHFGDTMGVYHSRFTNNERVEIWEKVKRGAYSLVLGTRSALWLPYKDPGLFIIDEEHDGSYKQKDPAPRFHARDAAIYLAGLYGAKVILGSATPSVESLYNVQQKKFGYTQLAERYQGVGLPEVHMVDARTLEQVRKEGIRLLTPALMEAITRVLKQHKQVILFQNKRGYSPFQMCRSCGWVPHCKNCAVSLTYHKSTDKLHCHYCGLRARVLHQCLHCGSTDLVSRSFGTEKIEEEVQQVFPKARVARMDTDSTRGKQQFARLLDQLQQHKIDILVGTQMVVKGLDFPNVSLVGILSADSLLSYPDFRVNERAFQLMSQVSGRAGRSDGAGQVLVQGYNLQHPVLQWVKEHDVRSFYLSEIGYRQQFSYPPFSRLIRVICRHRDEQKAIDVATAIAGALQSLQEITVQGPVPAGIARIRNQYVQEVWIRSPRDSRLLEQIKQLLKQQRDILSARKGLSTVQVIFDVDPV